MEQRQNRDNSAYALMFYNGKAMISLFYEKTH